jgi:hypothetical protein
LEEELSNKRQSDAIKSPAAQEEEVRANDRSAAVADGQSPNSKLVEHLNSKLVEHLTKQANVSDSDDSQSEEIAFIKTDDKED